MVTLKLVPIICIVIIHHLNANNIGVRKDVLQLTDEEKETILDGLYIMRNTTSKYDPSYSVFDYFAYVHTYAFDLTFKGALGHNSWSFLPWHRAFGLMFEKAMQEALDDDTFRMPYWDISNPNSTWATLWDEDFLGGNGDVNNSDIIVDTARLNCDDFPINVNLTANTSVAGIPCLVRQMGRNPYAFAQVLPPWDSWEEILDAGYVYDVEPYRNYPLNGTFYQPQQFHDSFRGRIEGVFALICNESIPENASNPFDPKRLCPGMHNVVHSYMGGTIVLGPATLDPVFFLLHNWIDAMWALYQDKYGDDTFPDEFMNVTLFDGGHFDEWDITALDVFDTEELGYVYQVQIDRKSNGGDDGWWTDERIAGIVVGIVVVSLIICIGCIGCCRKNKKKKRDEYQQFNEL